MKEFWRICHRTKVSRLSGTFLGPYSCTYDWDGQVRMARAHNDSGHPTPQEEGPQMGQWFRRQGDKVVCGADSLDSLMRWFRGWTTELTMAGFIVRAYEVPDLMIRSSERTGQAVAIVEPKDLVIECEIREVVECLSNTSPITEALVSRL